MIAFLSCLEECSGLLEISSVKPLGETVVDSAQHMPRRCALALLVPQPAQTDRCP